MVFTIMKFFFKGGASNITELTPAKKQFMVSVESIRTLTYLSFWFFCLFATFVNDKFSVPYLAVQYDENGDPILKESAGCAPFKGTGTFNPIGEEPFTIDRRYGFDQKTESHLQEFFGFGNICTAWDYKPSREATAMIFPIFEYSIVAYITLNYIQCWIQHGKGLITDGYWWTIKFLAPIQIMFAIWFRLIFVFEAYSYPSGHTFGFLTLQFCLLSVNIMNPLYVLQTNQEYAFLEKLGCGRCKVTKLLAWTNMIVTAIIASIKLYLTIHIVMHAGQPGDQLYPDWFKQEFFSSGMVIGQVVDQLFMVFVAALPCFISIMRWKSEPALVFQVDVHEDKEGGTSGGGYSSGGYGAVPSA